MLTVARFSIMLSDQSVFLAGNFVLRKMCEHFSWVFIHYC